MVSPDMSRVISALSATKRVQPADIPRVHARVRVLTRTQHPMNVERIELAAWCHMLTHRPHTLVGEELWLITLDIHGMDISMRPGTAPQQVVADFLGAALALELIPLCAGDTTWHILTTSRRMGTWVAEMLASLDEALSAHVLAKSQIVLPPAVASVLSEMLLQRHFASPLTIGRALESLPRHGAPGFSVINKQFIVADALAVALLGMCDRTEAHGERRLPYVHLLYLLLLGFCDGIIEAKVYAYEPQPEAYDNVSEALRRAREQLHAASQHMPLREWRSDGQEFLPEAVTARVGALRRLFMRNA